MTIKQEAQELVEKFRPFADPFYLGNLSNSKQCAIEAAKLKYEFGDIIMAKEYENNDYYNNHLQQLITEIEKL